MNERVTRRNLLRNLGLGVAAFTARPLNRVMAAAGEPLHQPPTEFTLPPLPYADNALEPHLDARTMEIHYGKHHQAYVNSLNAALKGHANLLSKPIEQLLKNLNDVPEKLRTPVRNFGGGHYNHVFYWNCMKANGGGEPAGDLAKAIKKKFGSVIAFKQLFSATATRHFGSGWGWLVKNRKGDLAVVSTPNQDCPLSHGQIPLLTVDVWEHAYYLHYQNRRSDFVAAWWNVVNWDAVAAEFGRQ
ncbi:MAG: superoxide dismutase [Verrucomicrobia bacterium]|nr:superoxide dismutase [Verrucomicrobiota bacterium]